eukprot:355607-Chlamydomonas_euryale.AAC.5
MHRLHARKITANCHTSQTQRQSYRERTHEGGGQAAGRALSQRAPLRAGLSRLIPTLSRQMGREYRRAVEALSCHVEHGLPTTPPSPTSPSANNSCLTTYPPGILATRTGRVSSAALRISLSPASRGRSALFQHCDSLSTGGLLKALRQHGEVENLLHLTQCSPVRWLGWGGIRRHRIVEIGAWFVKQMQHGWGEVALEGGAAREPPRAVGA